MSTKNQLVPGISTQTPILEVGGDILSTNVDFLRQDLSSLLEASKAATVFELRLPNTKMVDSAGLNLLVWFIKSVRARGGVVRIALSDRNVLRTFQFTRLDREIEIVRTESLEPKRKMEVH